MESGFCKLFLLIICFFDGSYRLIYLDLFDFKFENIMWILNLVNLMNLIWVMFDFYLDKYVVIYLVSDVFV